MQAPRTALLVEDDAPLAAALRRAAFTRVSARPVSLRWATSLNAQSAAISAIAAATDRLTW